ncbi:hypothetical protein BDR06DRAFT_1037553 [Suillus hirtellus]|nr:hypothetical protein BDR06DRAFT_1037553 [Suillus hirtellus]
MLAFNIQRKKGDNAQLKMLHVMHTWPIDYGQFVQQPSLLIGVVQSEVDKTPSANNTSVDDINNKDIAFNTEVNPGMAMRLKGLVSQLNCNQTSVNVLNCSEAGEDISDLLKKLEFHPLSINLLANTVQQDDWSPATLLKRWHTRHSAVLNTGKGNLHSLADTMQLSLDSPSIQGLGEDGHCTIAIIAFLLQGLNDNLDGNLLPLLQEVDNICNVLCRQSLIYHQDNFIKNSFTYELKSYCLWRLGWLYITVSQLTDTMKIIKAAEALYLATGNHKMVAECVPLVRTHTDVKAASSNPNNFERAFNAPSHGSISVNQQKTKFGISWMLLGCTPSPHLQMNYEQSCDRRKISAVGEIKQFEEYNNTFIKHHPQEVRFTSSLMNHITNESRIIERMSKDAKDLDVPHLRSPTPQSIMHQDMQELLEIVDCLHHQVSYLQQEHEELEEETEQQQKELNDIMEHKWLNVITCNERNEFLQDVISRLTYTDDL